MSEKMPEIITASCDGQLTLSSESLKTDKVGIYVEDWVKELTIEWRGEETITFVIDRNTAAQLKDLLKGVSTILSNPQSKSGKVPIADNLETKVQVQRIINEWKTECDCRFANDHSSEVELCEKCSQLKCHGGEE